MANRFSAIAKSIIEDLNKEEPQKQPGVRLFVPTISDRIILTNDWYFKLRREYRNQSLISKWAKANERSDELISYSRDEHERKDARDPIYVLLPIGTILMVDRIYIRGKGQDYRAFDSLTFRILKGSPCKELVGARFWANLRYVNQIVCDLYKPEA